jgi:hypothetical protein
LVGVATGSERHAKDDVRDDQMEHTADREAGARGVLERIAVGRPVGDTV